MPLTFQDFQRTGCRYSSPALELHNNSRLGHSRDLAVGFRPSISRLWLMDTGLGGGRQGQAAHYEFGDDGRRVRRIKHTGELFFYFSHQYEPFASKPLYVLIQFETGSK